MTDFVRYTEAGEVVDWGNMPDDAIDYEIELGRRTARGGANSPDFWVDIATGQVHPKTENPAHLHGMVIRDVPNPSWILIGLTKYPCTDGTAELEFTQPGTYEVIVKPVRHLPKTFTVEVP